MAILSAGIANTETVNDRLLLQQAMESCPARKTSGTLRIAFIGDVMLHQAQITGACRGNGDFDFSEYFAGIKDDLEGADLAIANMEFTMAGEPYTGYPAFSAPDEYAEYMADCGVDVFLTGRRTENSHNQFHLRDQFLFRQALARHEPHRSRGNPESIGKSPGLGCGPDHSRPALGQ